jgi:hypothetical protein
MGQLRAGILGLQKVLLETEPKIKQVEETLSTHSGRISQLCITADEGYNDLYLYLVEKFKKAGSTPDAQGTKTLKEIMDPSIGNFVKGIIQWKGDLKQAIAGMNTAMGTSKAELLNTIISAGTQSMQLKALAEKKKDKLFKSAKYKDKLKGYLAALDTVLKVLKTYEGNVKGATSRFTDGWVEKNFAVSPDLTVAQVKDRTSMNLNSTMKVYEDNKAQIDTYVRKWRDEYKSIPGQLATMKKWVDEADAMELEAK